MKQFKRFRSVKIFDFVRSAVAQLAERLSVKEDVTGPIPVRGARLDAERIQVYFVLK